MRNNTPDFRLISVSQLCRSAGISLLIMSMMFLSVVGVHAKSPHVPAISTSSKNEILLPVFYITNRQIEPDADATEYGVQRGEHLEFGTASWGNEGTGKRLSKPKISSTAQEQFFQQLADAQVRTGDKGVIVFVHGYDCSFEKAMQMGNKFMETSGLPVVIFSWPSRSNYLTYAVDETTAEWSSAHFVQTLQLLREQIGDHKITLVAHSMGCRVVSWALQSSQMASAAYKHILFCSPDIDTGIFKNYLKTMINASKYIAVFASRRDFRLKLSRFIHGNDRLGFISGAVESNKNVHFVDLSKIDRSLAGHAIPYKQISQILHTDSFSSAVALPESKGNTVSPL